MKKIIIDSREFHLINFFKAKRDILIEIETQKLDVGDIVVSDTCAIERKEGFDYVISLTDNRLFEQLLRLKETYSSPMLIVEGLNKFVFDNINVKLSSVYGSLAYIINKLQINVIYTVNLEHTALLIERLALQTNFSNSNISNNRLVIRSAPKKLDPNERRQYIIEGLIECGNKKAKILIDRFKTPYEVFMSIRNTKVLYSRTGKPKGISGPISELKGFGYRFIEENQKLLFENENPNLIKNIEIQNCLEIKSKLIKE